MAVVHGCGCAPDAVVQWGVVGLLGVAGALALGIGWWRRQRATRPGPPTATDAPAAHRATRVERSAATVAGLVIVGLALLVALVPMGSDAALLVLALGATIGSGGIALGSPRTRRGVSAPQP